jgi:hypothetical protein
MLHETVYVHIQCLCVMYMYIHIGDNLINLSHSWEQEFFSLMVLITIENRTGMKYGDHRTAVSQFSTIYTVCMYIIVLLTFVFLVVPIRQHCTFVYVS